MAIRASAQQVRSLLRANKGGYPKAEQDHRAGLDECSRFLSTWNTSTTWPNSVRMRPSATQGSPWGGRTHRPQEKPTATCDFKILCDKQQYLPWVRRAAGVGSASENNCNSLQRMRLAAFAMHRTGQEATELSSPLDPRKRLGGAVRSWLFMGLLSRPKKKDHEDKIRLDTPSPWVRLSGSAVA
jgi:hypothetical protein